MDGDGLSPSRKIKGVIIVGKRNAFAFKLVISALIVLFVLALAGCSSSNKAGDNGKGEKQQASTQQDNKVYKLRISSFHPDTKSWNIALREFADIVEEKSGGKIKADFYPDSQLGDDRQGLEMLQAGSIEMTYTALLSSLEPKAAVFDLPYIFKDREHAWKVLDGPIGEEVVASLLQKGIRIIPGTFMENGWRNMTNNIRPIEKPEDLKGLKMRVMQIQQFITMFQAFGANPVPLSYSELYNALQTKVVDGQENPNENIYTAKFYEVQKYVSQTEHTFNVIPVVINEAWWQSLTPDLQKLVSEELVKAVKKQRQLAKEADSKSLVKLIDHGMQNNAVDKAPFIQIAKEKIWPMFYKQLGQDLIEKVANAQ